MTDTSYGSIIHRTISTHLQNLSSLPCASGPIVIALYFSSIFLGILSTVCLTALLTELWLAAYFTSLPSSKYFVSSGSRNGMTAKQRGPGDKYVPKSYRIFCVTVDNPQKKKKKVLFVKKRHFKTKNDVNFILFYYSSMSILQTI